MAIAYKEEMERNREWQAMLAANIICACGHLRKGVRVRSVYEALMGKKGKPGNIELQFDRLILANRLSQGNKNG